MAKQLTAQEAQQATQAMPPIASIMPIANGIPVSPVPAQAQSIAISSGAIPQSLAHE